MLTYHDRRSRTGCAWAGALAAMAVLAGSPRSAEALPQAPELFCDHYADASLCRGRLPACSTCHTSTSPAAWNAYGATVRGALGADFEATLATALASVEGLDSDADGLPNGDEIRMGGDPGDPHDGKLLCSSSGAAGYELERAFRRATVLYCGRSASFGDLETFRGLSDEMQRAALHDAVETCLGSRYWRDEGLPRIADRLIRPVYAVGMDSPIGIRLADYEYDYRLFSYVLTGDRDLRELLTAQYHVERDGDGDLVAVEGTIPTVTDNAGGQPLDVERRAGMITTQWFLMINTMFSPLPRTTAAQAYRSYLGFDISLQEGLYSVGGEPVDVDDKGVAQPDCEACHSTLDPLSYGFAYYNGIDFASPFPFGQYDPTRPERLIPGWDDPQSVLLGQPVGDVVEWAQAASETEAFTRTVAEMLFSHAFGRAPEIGEHAELDAAWQALAEDGYSANRLIHHLVDMKTFGGGVL
jgi:hypothetical protein